MPPTRAFEQCPAPDILGDLAQGTTEVKTGINSMYLGDLQALVPCLNLCMGDTGEPTNRVGPGTRDRSSVRKLSSWKLQKVVIKQLIIIFCVCMAQANQQLGKLAGLIVPKRWETYDTRTMVAVPNGLTA